jgi:hypothetical protein
MSFPAFLTTCSLFITDPEVDTWQFSPKISKFFIVHSVEKLHYFCVYICCFSDKPLWKSSFLSDNGKKWEEPWCVSSQ